ncbi:MAG: hypothetical protein R2830_00400 [Saprospiraceae bacterium]
MRTKPNTVQTDEIIAFVLFILCCVLSFFRQPIHEIPFTLLN